MSGSKTLSFPTHRHSSEFLFYAFDHILPRLPFDFLWWFARTLIASFMATSTADLLMFNKRNFACVTFPAETKSNGLAHPLSKRELLFHITRVAIGPFIKFWPGRILAG